MKARGHFRWWICALLFFGTTVNYIDRQVIAVLKPTLAHDLHWSEVDYSNIVMAFQAAYAAGYLLSGRLMDVIGLRLGYALSVGVWSLAAAAHGIVNSVLGFSGARAVLGIAEGGNFPAAVKTVSEWFPQKERALATGIFNAGSNFGPVLTPLVVPWLALRFGWRSAFVVTGLIGSLWILWWLSTYRKPSEHRSVSKEELEYIESDQPEPLAKIPWLGLLKYRATWAFAIGMALSGPIWWFYLFWAPDFLNKRFGLDLKNIGLPLVCIYLLADIGSVGGGWLSSELIKRGRSVISGRKIALLACALCVVPVYFAPTVSEKYAAVLLIGIAAAAHQGWSANLYTLVSDAIPRAGVSSVVGIGGMAGSVAAIFFSKYVGEVLQKSNNYQAILSLAPAAYLIAFIAIHLLVPSLSHVQGEK